MHADHLHTNKRRIIPAHLNSERQVPGSSQARLSVLGDYILEAQVGFLLRRAHQRHAAIFQESMGRLDLTPTQFTALITVLRAGKITQNLLGRVAGMDPATIQGVVKRLLARGLLRGTHDPMDRRTLVLAVTEDGRVLVEQAVPVAQRITEATLTPLSAAERGQLNSLLRKLG